MGSLIKSEMNELLLSLGSDVIIITNAFDNVDVEKNLFN